MPEIVCGLVIVAIVAAVVWPQSDFVIRVHGPAVDVRGRVPRVRADAIREFMAREFGETGRVKVRGKHARDGRLRLSFHGRISEGDQQRIRNFLLMQL